MRLEVAVLLELLAALEAKIFADAGMCGFVVLEVMVLHEAFVAALVRTFVAFDSLMGLQMVIELLLRVELAIADKANVLDLRVNRFLVLPQVKNAFEALAAHRASDGVVGVVGLEVRVAVGHGREGFEADGAEMLAALRVVVLQVVL